MRGLQLTLDQPGEEAAVTDEGLPLQGIPVHVLQLALLGTGVSAGGGGGGGGGGPKRDTPVGTGVCGGGGGGEESSKGSHRRYVHTYIHPLPLLLSLPSFLQTVS